ncbi:MAG: YceI family protein [bacterium]|nr:YceI family protein [bacterium]
MKKQFYILGALCLTFVFASCSGGEDTDKEGEGKAKEEKCFYSLNQDTYELKFTAYKTTGKLPVGGTFNDVTFIAGEAESMEEAIGSIAFEINTASIETNDEGRNAKISEHFFGTINTPTITGKVVSIDPEAGSAEVSFTMNGMSVTVPGNFTMDGQDFTFGTEIDVQKWNAVSGITALNEVCEDLHTGDDGVSLLWQLVDISFSGSLNKDCE